MSLHIISVVNSKLDLDLLLYNLDLLKEKNKNLKFDINILNNSKLSFKNKSNYQIIDIDNKNNSKNYYSHGSVQHGESLNIFFKTIFKKKYKYLLIIDPDIFMIKKNILSKNLTYMKKNKLTFYGSCWHPFWFRKFKNFPSIHCLFINTNIIDLIYLDFMPNNINQNQIPKNYNNKKKKNYKSLIRIIKFYTINRIFISKSMDTGSKIYLNFKSSKYKYDVFEPGLNNNNFFFQFPFLKNKFFRYFESLLPENISYLPKKFQIISDKYIKNIEYFYIDKVKVALHFRKTFNTNVNLDLVKSYLKDHL